jgi:serine/threonine-protein kinase
MLPVEPEPSSKSVHIVGRYALYDAIAAGGMATVHYGRLLGPVGFSRTVAIKRLHTQFARDPEFVSMFLDEARLAARIRHPNVVPTLDVVATDGELFLVMEYVPGESLARLVRTAAEKGDVVPPRIVSAIVCGLLRGLHAAHEAKNEQGEPLGIVHRDVSPQNVLVGIDGQARVLDFGVAKAAGRLQTTRDGKLKGKLAYMSPEQLRGKAIDRRTDIFAASVVLWEALVGRRLFRGDNEGAIITQILEGAVVAPSKVLAGDNVDASTLATIEAVDAIVLKGLATSLDVRWDTGRAMAAALEKALPPAGVSEVSEWVEHFAKDVLVTRAQTVADIESNSAVGPTSIRSIQESGRDSGHDLGQRSSIPTPAPSGGVLPVDLSTISVESRASIDPFAPKRRPPAVWAGIAAGVVALPLAIFAVVHFTAAAPVAEAPGAPPSSVPIPAPPASVASAEPVVSASATPEASATPPSTAAPASSASPPAQTAQTGQAPPKPPPHWAPPVHPASPPPAHTTTAPSCNPPFTYDAQGLKHFKPECL